MAGTRTGSNGRSRGGGGDGIKDRLAICVTGLKLRPRKARTVVHCSQLRVLCLLTRPLGSLVARNVQLENYHRSCLRSDPVDALEGWSAAERDSSVVHCPASRQRKIGQYEFRTAFADSA